MFLDASGFVLCTCTFITLPWCLSQCGFLVFISFFFTFIYHISYFVFNRMQLNIALSLSGAYQVVALRSININTTILHIITRILYTTRIVSFLPASNPVLVSLNARTFFLPPSREWSSLHPACIIIWLSSFCIFGTVINIILRAYCPGRSRPTRLRSSALCVRLSSPRRSVSRVSHEITFTFTALFALSYTRSDTQHNKTHTYTQTA